MLYVTYSVTPSNQKGNHTLTPCSSHKTTSPHLVSRVYNLAVLPHLVMGDLAGDEVPQLTVQPLHEIRAWRDTVGVKTFLCGQHLPPLLGLLLGVNGCPG